MVGAGQDGRGGGGHRAGHGGALQQLQVVGAVAHGQDAVGVEALVGAEGQGPAPLADLRRPHLQRGAAVDQVADQAGAAGRPDQPQDRLQQGRAGRPHHRERVHTGSASTTRSRSSTATHGLARARWPGWVEGWSPTTRSTSGRST